MRQECQFHGDGWPTSIMNPSKWKLSINFKYQSFIVRRRVTLFVSAMNPRFLPSALSRTNSPESVLLALRRHRSNKIAGAPEDFLIKHRVSYLKPARNCTEPLRNHLILL